MTEEKKHEARMAFSHNYNGPKSECQCGCSGDGPNSNHRDTVQAGHGKCEVCPSAKCSGFAWADWTPEFKIALNAFNDTLKEIA